MSNNDNYSSKEFGPTNFSIPNALSILQQPTPQELVQVKKGRGKQPDLDYVSAATVIRTINRAFGLRWSFEVVETRVVESADSYDKPVGPVVQTLGKLTIPGLGSRMQWGSQTVVGGQNVQEHTFKGSTSDALKKCASMFLVHLDLADGGPKESTGIRPSDIHPDDLRGFEDQAQEPPVSDKPEQPQPDEPEPDMSDMDLPPEVEESLEGIPEDGIPKKEPAPKEEPENKPEQTAPKPPAVDVWQKADVDEMKAHQERLGVKSNEELNPYVQKFFNDDSTTYQNLSPSTIKDFNHFLSGL